MRRGIDEPLEKIVEPPVDIAQRLTKARRELETAREELASFGQNVSLDNIPSTLAKERHRQAERILDSWERRQAVFEQQVFEIAVDCYAFQIVGILATYEVKQKEDSEPSPG